MEIIDQIERFPELKAFAEPEEPEKEPWNGCPGGCCTHEETPGNTCEGCGTTVCGG